MNAYNFTIQYSDGSLYQGRTYARDMVSATNEILRTLPEFPGDPEPVRIEITMKQG